MNLSDYKMPELTDELRPGLSQTHAWTTSLDSWLQSVRPSAARALLTDKESFLREIDRLAWAVIRFVGNTRQTPDDYAEALKQEGPQADEDDMDAAATETPLTKAERNQFQDWAVEAENPTE